MERVAILKRAVTYSEAKEFVLAKRDIDAILAIDPTDSEAYYLSGMMFQKQSKQAVIPPPASP